ncbi:hypothetical protein [Kitasatospora sp. NPDC057015]|uniref:hypothetical protein n=1 Tax=Kitasatospora sp. NPDC057015 TaxID=3346001 RepID=UPI00364061CA
MPPGSPPVGPAVAAPVRPGFVPADETVHLHGAHDTLQVIANADRWAQLTHALDEARVPLAVGDVDAMRRLAKLEQPVLDALTRWIGTANRGRPGGSGRPGGG